MKNIKQTCWQLFYETGDINYYRLYHALNKQDERSKSNGDSFKGNWLSWKR